MYQQLQVVTPTVSASPADWQWIISSNSLSTFLSCRERVKAQTRYDEWQSLRETALKNRAASGASGPLPLALTTPAPPRPPIDEDDAMDITVDLSAAGGMGMDSFVSDGPLQMEVPQIDQGELMVSFYMVFYPTLRAVSLISFAHATVDLPANGCSKFA